MLFRTDDPVADADRYFAEQEREVQKLPKCYECENPIQTEHCYEVNDELICPDCMERNHRKLVDDYVS